MGKLYIARRALRRGLLLPQGMNKANPGLIFPLDGVGRSELDELARASLQKQGITSEADVQAVIENAEADYEKRIKVGEARKELRRLMALRAEGAKLMQVGFRRWKQVFYRPIKGR